MPKKTEGSRDLVREALLLGFGLIDLTKEKVEKVVKDVKRDKDINKQDADKIVDEVIGKMEKGKKVAEKVIRKQINKVRTELDLDEDNTKKASVSGGKKKTKK